jgi:1-acyl-sn-glycerol-3-phosphate acyltransferase
MTNKIRGLTRGILLVFLILRYVIPLSVRPLLRGFNLPWALRLRTGFAKNALKLLGVEVELIGSLPPPGRYIYVGNHRSYLDPIVAMKFIEALPVAKAEVASWPLIGYGAKASGIMYVKRESKSSRAATLQAIRKTTGEGYSVLVYPEGTTHTLPHVMEFRPGVFRLAAKEGISILPVTIDYLDKGDAWVGKETFIPHFLRCFGKKTTYVKISFGSPILSTDADVLVGESMTLVNNQLKTMREEFDRFASSKR